MSPDTRDVINGLITSIENLHERVAELEKKLERLEERAGTDSEGWRF